MLKKYKCYELNFSLEPSFKAMCRKINKELLLAKSSLNDGSVIFQGPKVLVRAYGPVMSFSNAYGRVLKYMIFVYRNELVMCEIEQKYAENPANIYCIQADEVRNY